MWLWITNNRDGLIVGIITSIIVTFGVWFIKNGIQLYVNRSSKYSGKWIQMIYERNDYSGIPVKKDVYNIKHKRIRYAGKLVINVEGRIKRSYPENQNHRKWDVIGYLEGDVLTLLYQSQEGQKSRGCIYAKLYTDFEFRGFYLEEHKDGRIDKTPVIIKKNRSDW